MRRNDVELRGRMDVFKDESDGVCSQRSHEI